MPSADSPCVCHLVRGTGCDQGRKCPLREIEMASDVAPNFNPQGDESMDYQYRYTSSVWTGYAPRTTEDRWPTPPRSVTNSGWLRRFIARLFGR